MNAASEFAGWLAGTCDLSPIAANALSLVWMWPFKFIFQNHSCLRIHANFLRSFGTLNVKRVAQSAPAFLLLKFFVGNFSRMRFECDGTGVSHSNFGILGELLAREWLDAGMLCGRIDISGNGHGADCG